jgi:hypothetical protein
VRLLTRLHKLKKNLLLSGRLALSQARSYPSFMVIGAQKCGTTTMFSCLAAHPQVIPPLTKEIHYFDGGRYQGEDVYVDKGSKWYIAHFPMVSKLTHGNCKTFEASPSYLYVPEAAERIARDLPEARLLVLLRNPVERAISHYRHNVSKGREPLTFKEALKRESSRLASSESWHRSVYAYVDRGFYVRQLMRFQSFRNQGQLLVLDSAVFFREPRLAMSRVYEFLGLDSSFRLPDVRPRNIGRTPTVAISNQYEELRDRYRPENEKLWNWIQEDFGWDD